MKLCRFGAAGKEKPGLIDGSRQLRDLSAIVPDIGPAQIDRDTLARIARTPLSHLPIVDGKPRFGVPVAGISKCIAIGLNYYNHATEMGLAIPTEPIMFMKAISSLSGPDDEVVLPRGAAMGDWEVELGVVMGRTSSYVSEEKALDHVAGYVIANDISERFNQMQRGTQWSKGKSHDTFCPLGPWLVTLDEVDPDKLSMFLDLNGLRMQTGNTADMIFPVPKLIAYVSEFVTLHPGDVILTGTPAGVGGGQRPSPVFLRDGDEMHLGIEGLGEQRQAVVAWRPTT